MAPEGRLGTSTLVGIAILLALLVSASASAHPGRLEAAGSSRTVPASSGTWFDYLVIILMENHAICQILTSCGGTATYMTSLASASGLATKFVDCNRPSLPNYLCLSGASDFGCGGYDGYPHSNTCTNLGWNSPNIVDLLVNASLTWKGYAETMPSNCYGVNSGSYYVRHFPFPYYNDIISNSSRTTRCVPAGTNGAALLTDLGSTSTASNYMWFTPNGCNDMHDCSVATGDNYLKGLVPKILNSTVFKTQRAALFITFDEDSGGTGAPNLYTVWAGPVAKTQFTSSVAYNHFSLLSTIEANWNLPYLTTHDQSAANMGEFFGVSNPPPPDTTPPTIAIDAPTNHSTITTASVSVTGAASDNAAVQKVEVSTDGTTWTTASGTTSWSRSLTLANGTHTVYARATDTSANVRTAWITITVNISGTGNPPPPPPTSPSFGPPALVLIEIPMIGFALVIATTGAILWSRNRRKRTL